MHRTVWGTAVIPPTGFAEGDGALPADAQLGPQDDGWLQGWERDLMDHHDQQQVLAEIEGLSLAAESSSQAKITAGAGKKGKKGKKITLMSTTARRGA